jgi:hypothetical protein
MAVCDPDTLLEQARCYYGLDAHRLNVIVASLWCQISENIAPPGTPGGIWNPDVNGGSGGPIVNPDSGGGPLVNPDI